MSSGSFKIFLSYSWSNFDIADTIDLDFQSLGVTLLRDVRDGEYRKSIKEFMRLVGKTDFVLMIISDSFLKSENCMYELIELLNSHEFEKRVLPVLLENVKIFEPKDRIVYYQYWEDKIATATENLIKYKSEDFQQQLKHAQNVRNTLPEFFVLLSDLFTKLF